MVICNYAQRYQSERDVFIMKIDIHRGLKAGIPQHTHKFGAEAGFVPNHRSGDLRFHNSFQVCGQFKFLFLKLKTEAALFSFLFLSASHRCHYLISHSQETCLIWLWILKHQRNTLDNNRLKTSYDLPISAEEKFSTMIFSHEGSLK